MNHRFIAGHIRNAVVLLFSIFCCVSQSNSQTREIPLPTSHDVLSAFRNPPAEYRSAPLWVWNDRMTREQIDEQLADLKEHGMGGVFVHPRPGLITPYLSEEWLSLVRHTVETGKKLGMKIWLYDENSYPSGFAGGNVPAEMPDAGRAGLRMTRAKTLTQPVQPTPLVVLSKDSAGFTDITQRLATGSFGPGDYYIFAVLNDRPSRWYGGFTYVDIMRREVTEKFIDVTMNAYKRVLGDEFGKIVPGVFQDEAEINPASEPGAVVVNYTPALFDRFRLRSGYDLGTHLPSMYEEVGDWRSVRHDFYATLLDLLIDNWAKPYYDYCSAHNLVFTGHYWEHEWPRPVINPDNLACAAYAHMPGIDVLMNEYRTEPDAQFGNVRAVKEIRSVANQLGRTRTMSETFGAGGWDMSFFDQKRIADWEYALGVNFMNQHLSYATIKGARKRDHPLSFSYHEPWWDLYRPLGDYYGRLSVALSAGEQVNKILILEPTTTAWMYATPQRENKRLAEIGKSFQDFVTALEAAQVEYDLTSEDILRNHGRATGRQLEVGMRAYDLVVLPPGMQNLEGSTLALLSSYLGAGGSIVCCGLPPEYVDGKESSDPRLLSNTSTGTWIRAGEEDLLNTLVRLSPPFLGFRANAGVSFDAFFHHRRTLKDCELLFLANTDPGKTRSGTITAPGASCDQWDLFSGGSAPYPAVAAEGKLTVAFTIPPGGSLLLCLRPGGKAADVSAPAKWSVLAVKKPMTIRRAGPNVLTLDYCDLTLDGNPEPELYFYDAQLKTFRKHGLDANPWDSGVQFRTSILDQNRFDPESGFMASFRFAVAAGTDVKSLQAVVERPELFSVSINGKKLDPLSQTWWLDKSFGVFDIGPFVRPGENSLAVTARPFTIHTELEPVYILGNMSLDSRQKGFELRPARVIRPGPWNEQGMPFYAGRVSYTREFKLAPGTRAVVALGRWSGVVAVVAVNGKQAGWIGCAPFELEVTHFLRPSDNVVTVTVYGSLKNTLGPHHNSPPPGKAWPGQFQKGAAGGFPPGTAYSTIGYGLFEEFVLNVSGK